MHIYLSSFLINDLLGPETDKCEDINLPLTPDCQLIRHEYKYLQLDQAKVRSNHQIEHSS